MPGATAFLGCSSSLSTLNGACCSAAKPVVHQHDDAASSSSFGDTTVVLKRAWRIDDASAAGMEFSVKLPTAREPIATRPASGLTQFFAGVVFPLARVW